MLTLQEIKTLLDQGKTEEVLERSGALLARGWGITPKDIQETLALRAWAYYRRKEFEEARKEALAACTNEMVSYCGENELALRCLATIAAYVDKDSVKMRQYIDKLPDSPARDNTFMIYAREPSDTTPGEEILGRAFKWIVHDPQDKLNTANLLNNTARWLLAKGGGGPDALLALGFMNAAIGLYGVGSQNLHHRASAWYWVSVIQEKLLGKAAAVSACETSVRLWKKQVKADPTNPHFQKSLEGAKARLKELKKEQKVKN